MTLDEAVANVLAQIDEHAEAQMFANVAGMVRDGHTPEAAADACEVGRDIYLEHRPAMVAQIGRTLESAMTEREGKSGGEQ